MHTIEDPGLTASQETHDEVPDENDKETANAVLEETETDSNVQTNDQTKVTHKANKNLAILSVSFLLLFAAFHSLQNLQSSINVAGGLGNVGLTALYVAFLVSCVFLPPFVLSKLGMKRTIIISMFGYVTYTLASFHANWWTVIPASVVLGVMASTLWTGQMCYVTELAKMYSDGTGANQKHCSTRYFGIFYAVYHTGKPLFITVSLFS